MKNKKIIISIIIIFSFIVLINNNIVHAQGNPAALDKLQTFAKDDVGLEAQKNPLEITLNIIKTVLSFVGLIFLILIIVSGFQWMTSGGNEELISKAKKRLINATIGLVIILGAWIIANTIMLIVQGKPLKEDNWINIF